MSAKKVGFWIAGVLLFIVIAALIGFWVRPVSYFDGMMYLHEELSGIENRSAKVEGYQLHYLVEGPVHGAPVVLVHGLGGRAEDWRMLAPFLAQAGFRVYLPDLLGYGRSARPASFSYSVRDEATVVVDFMDAIGLKQVDLGGWSMGGWIVQIVAATHPDRVKRLMLFDSAGLGDKPNWDTNLFMPTTSVQLDDLEALLMPHPPHIPGFVARDILRISADHAWVIRRSLDTMLTGDDITNQMLPGLKMPVLILWGAEDHIIPLLEGQQMHKLIPHSELDVFRGCGHLAPEQCTNTMGPMVVDYLKQQ